MNKKFLIFGSVGLSVTVLTALGLLTIFLLILGSWIRNIPKPPETPQRAVSEIWQAHHISINEDNTDSFDKLLYLKYEDSPMPPFIWDGQKILLLKETLNVLKNDDESAKKREKMNLVTDVSDIKEALYFVTYSINFNGNGRRDSFRHYFILKNLPATVFNTAAWKKDELLIQRGSSIMKTHEICLLTGELSILELNSSEELKVKYDDKEYVIQNHKEKVLDSKTRKISIKEERLKPILIEATKVEKLEYEIYDYGALDFKTELVVHHDGLAPIQLK